MSPQVARDWREVPAELDVERVAQGVSWVCAHHHRPVASSGAPDCRRRGDRRFANATLAREQDHSHKVSVSATALLPGGWSAFWRGYVVLNQCLNVLEDREHHLCVSLYRRQDLHVLKIGLVGLCAGVIEREPIFLSLPVAGQQQDGACVCRLNGEEEVQQDEGLGVEIEKQDGIADQPDADGDG